MKLMLIVDALKDETYFSFGERILSLCKAFASHHSVERIKVVMTDIKPPGFSIIPFDQRKVAVVSVYTNTTEAIDLSSFDVIRGIYQVEEALPVGYNKDWKDEEVTPGVNLLTFFRRKKDIEYDVFLDRWHNGHTPLSLKIHPLWNYNRNVVRSTANDDQIWYDGIVEEQVKERSQLLNPLKFFGHPGMLLPNMLRVYLDVKGFIDYSSIETYLANEYWLKS